MAMHRTRIVTYWIFTLIVALEMVAGAMWDLLQIGYVQGVMTHLGYPHYLLYIIGIWKLPCAAALLSPRFPTLKEWAYAGAVFNYTGAAASHLFAGDAVGAWLGPLIFTAMTAASWALRPKERRLSPAPLPALRPRTWVATTGVLVAFLIFSLLTLPGPPGQ
jgi:hypothetical protein